MRTTLTQVGLRPHTPSPFQQHGTQSVQGCPLVIGKGNHENFLSHFSDMNNTVKLY